MAKKLQLRRGTTAQHSSFTGDVGECTVDTDKDTIVVHDNSTAGGRPLAREDLSNVSSATIVSNIDDDSVTYAKLQNVSATDRLLGRDTAGAGDVEEITPANVRTMLNVADGANNYSHPNHSGDVTSTGDGATVIADDAVTYAKMQNLGTANRVLGGTATGAISEVQVAAAMIADEAVTEPKLSTTSAGSTGQFLQKTGATTMDWVTLSTQAFPSGTLMLFQQTSAPTGWTKQTTHDDAALRIVNGSVSPGGSTGFATVFGSSVSTSGHTLAISEIPSHSHVLSPRWNGVPGPNGPGNRFAPQPGQAGPYPVGSAGGGGSHSHNLSMNIKFVDVIIAQAD